MAKAVLKALNSLVDLAVILGILLAGSYSAYALWDNRQIYVAAENVRTELLKLKPEPESSGGGSFEELRRINPDVCAWITLDHTGIDYPVLQGRDNLSYINTDVYGGFALAGSIFLDSRSDSAFQDPFSLLYGHHMENSKMFGDLDLYREEAFFSADPTGTLILPDRTCHLEIFACLLTPASQSAIFDPTQAEITELLDLVTESAIFVRTDVTERIRTSEADPRILGLATCSPEFTDARTVVLALMEPCSQE